MIHGGSRQSYEGACLYISYSYFNLYILIILVIYKESMFTVADYLYINIGGLARPQGRYIYINIMNSTCILKHYQLFSIFWFKNKLIDGNHYFWYIVYATIANYYKSFKNLLTSFLLLNFFVIFFWQIELFLSIQYPKIIILSWWNFNPTWQLLAFTASGMKNFSLKIKMKL